MSSSRPPTRPLQLAQALERFLEQFQGEGEGPRDLEPLRKKTNVPRCGVSVDTSLWFSPLHTCVCPCSFGSAP